MVNVDTTAAASYVHLDTLVGVHAQPALLSYQVMGLMNVALEVLGARDVRELNRSCARPEQFQKLRSFCKNVHVTVEPGHRVKRVAVLLKQAGREEFDKG